MLETLELLVSCSNEQVLISSLPTQVPCTAKWTTKGIVSVFLKTENTFFYNSEKSFEEKQGWVLLPLQSLGFFEIICLISLLGFLVLFWFGFIFYSIVACIHSCKGVWKVGNEHNCEIWMAKWNMFKIHNFTKALLLINQSHGIFNVWHISTGHNIAYTRQTATYWEEHKKMNFTLSVWQ